MKNALISFVAAFVAIICTNIVLRHADAILGQLGSPRLLSWVVTYLAFFMPLNYLLTFAFKQNQTEESRAKRLWWQRRR
jgi:hypothetical protein